MEKFFKKFTFFSDSKLLRQVILACFFWGMALLFTVTMFNSYTYYEAERKKIIAEINYLEKVIDTSLAGALWTVDKNSTNNILDVMVQNPHVARAYIKTNDGFLFESKSALSPDWITIGYPLIHQKESGGGTKQLGTLYLSLSKEQFYRNVIDNIITSMERNFVRFILLLCCIVYIFNKKVLIPLQNIQQMTKEFNDEHLTPILGGRLSKSNMSVKNEMEALHKDIDVLQENFVLAFFMQQKAKEVNHEIEMQLEKERQKLVLAQRLETIGQITAQVAHDFGNLIMIINGKTKTLDNRLSDPEDLKLTESIRKATAKAHSLIKKILSMTRAQKHEMVMLDPFKSILEIQDLLKLSIGSQIALNVETDGSNKLIQVEPSSYENVIINLCVNARDAMPEGGAIDISLKSIWKSNIEFVAISIKDTGTGIPEDIQAKIFDPFFTTKPEGKGTGLGLSQVQEFVKSAGGSLELSSKKEGTCFTLLLPNKAPKEELSAA